MDRITIKNLKCFARHGVLDEEKKNGQFFLVDAVLYTDTRNAGCKDELTLSTDYGAVCHTINNWMEQNVCDLIETVAERLAELILMTYPLVHELDLTIHKPGAPIGLPFQDVSVNIHRGWHQVYLSVGSNMGDRYAYIRGAMEDMEKNRYIRNIKASSLLVTKPYGNVEQEDFVNGAIALETTLSPEELLDFLHETEAGANRVRTIHWGPRTLDLDILFYDRLVYESDNLVIPHVDMENRYFVLKPLSEIAPNMRHPILLKTVTQLLSQVQE